MLAESPSADPLLCDSWLARIGRSNDLGWGLICRASLSLSSVMCVCAVGTHGHASSLSPCREPLHLAGGEPAGCQRLAEPCPSGSLLSAELQWALGHGPLCPAAPGPL